MQREEARKRVSADLNGPQNDSGEELVILDAETIEKPYGWVFFYQSKQYVQTGEPSYRLAGNGPIVLLVDDCSIHYLGSACSIEETIGEFEEQKGLL